MSGGEGVVERALRCLGRGFDVTYDFRERYCRGKDRLVLLSRETTELAVPGFGFVRDVSVDVKCEKGERMRYQSDVLEFTQMSELLNRKSSLTGKMPLGCFNSSFQFNGGAWARDAAETKCLAFDGYFISLFNLRIDRPPFTLTDSVVNAVPSVWNPAALARFIENHGTHIVVGLSVGGQDVVFVRQDESSSLPPAEIKDHLYRLGDQLFTGTCTLPPLHQLKTKDYRPKVPDAFNVFDQKQSILPDGLTSVLSKSGITVICSKRGGDTTSSSHCEWLPTVSTMPDIINFTFVPITSLLKDVPGKNFLTHAINLYLRYQPPISDLEYFLDFQTHRAWAPMLNDHPLGPCSNMSLSTPALQFNLMGPKLYVNTAQVTVGRKPVTGMRLYLEGMKNDRLAMHLQHLSTTPSFLRNLTDDRQLLRGSEELTDEGYIEPVLRKTFSHVCTAAVKYDTQWSDSGDGETKTAFIVTGAQLHVKTHDSRSVLHLRLLYSAVPGCIVTRSAWERGSLRLSQKLGLFSTISTTLSGAGVERDQKPTVLIDSAMFPTGPPVPVQAQRLLKFVDPAELCRGPQDCPGYWLVTGAKLNLQNGKIGVHVKFSLLNPIC